MPGVRIGYWAAHEQYSPTQLTKFVIAAEDGGFETVFTSDHFMPWFNTGAQGGFAWTWIAACAAMTKRIQFGTAVTAPDRYHPAIIAQAFATLNEMFPGRIMLGLGAGEAMNTIPLGIVFPSPGQRILRLKNALEIIRKLWGGDFEDYNGFFYDLHNARLYTPPRTKIPLFVAAGWHRSANLAGKYADGVIGFSGSENIIQLALDSARKNGKNPDQFERLIEFKCSYDPDYQRALDSVKVWRSTMTKGVLSSSTADPRKLEDMGASQVSDKKIEETWAIVTKVEDLIKPIEDYVKQGYSMIQVHSSSPDELSFVRAFAAKALPALKEMYPTIRGR
ncbi:MAG TPA: TIGR03557 family F420-dependent LLM class oxidoreductase [Nitrososphaerales archaeon]|nr:TIGR03557 family F420-dependent LLM class oxidoreductase [Nitrososphaerales archaeon]